MSNNWHQVHTELTDFIAGHSEIKIEPNHVYLPDNVRPEFYRLFDIIRTAFVEEESSALLREAQDLSKNYVKVEGEVIKLLGLSEIISTSSSLDRFLHNPLDELIRELFDPLFDLTKRKKSIEEFKETASQKIDASFENLYRTGYENWLTLSMVKLLEADKLFQVTVREDLTIEEIHLSKSKEEVPAPQHSERISFYHGPNPMFTVPDFIVHSARMNKYIAIRSHIGDAFALATNASEKRKWDLFTVITEKYGLPFKDLDVHERHSISPIYLDFTLIYVDDNLKDLALIADKERICRPDLIIDCRRKDWYKGKGLEQIKLNHDVLKPALGTYIVSKEPVPEDINKKLGGDIRILTAGLNQSELKHIISLFTRGNDFSASQVSAADTM